MATIVFVALTMVFGLCALVSAAHDEYGRNSNIGQAFLFLLMAALSAAMAGVQLATTTRDQNVVAVCPKGPIAKERRVVCDLTLTAHAIFKDGELESVTYEKPQTK